jgi:hypothetical protein
MTVQSNHLRALGPAKESHQLDSRKLSEICSHLDELSSYWSELNIGESISIHWPDLTICEAPR